MRLSTAHKTFLLTSGHSGASECPDVKNYKWRLNPVRHRMLCSCTHMATVGVKGLIDFSQSVMKTSMCVVGGRSGAVDEIVSTYPQRIGSIHSKSHMETGSTVQAMSAEAPWQSAWYQAGLLRVSVVNRTIAMLCRVQMGQLVIYYSTNTCLFYVFMSLIL